MCGAGTQFESVKNRVAEPTGVQSTHIHYQKHMKATYILGEYKENDTSIWRLSPELHNAFCVRTTQFGSGSNIHYPRTTWELILSLTRIFQQKWESLEQDEVRTKLEINARIDSCRSSVHATIQRRKFSPFSTSVQESKRPLSHRKCWSKNVKT